MVAATDPNVNCYVLNAVKFRLILMKPGEKADFIRMLQEKGHTVLMTGDGFNDAGALMPVSSVKVVAFATFVTLAAGRFSRR